jgi:hypothetical protein
MVNGTVAGSNEGRRGREALEGSLWTPRRVFEAILVEEKVADLFFGSWRRERVLL